MQKKKESLNVKDLINIGIYTALYLVVFFVVGLLTAIPIIYPALFLIWPIVTGIPFMLYMTKIKKPGMIFISSIILSLAWFLIGYPWSVLVTYFISGILAELAFKKANYKDFKYIVIGYWFFSTGIIGIQLPIWFMKDYLVEVRGSMGDQYANQLAMVMPKWMLFGGVGLLFIGCVIGALIGKKMLKKHFKKAGIA
ncbi:MptD family putative ECF transporter S component [Peptostreptococcaceae bacterium AGR-M142]